MLNIAYNKERAKRLKKYYPKDMMFCLFGDGCKKICQRKISDYELRILNYEVGWQDFRNTEECKLNEVGD